MDLSHAPWIMLIGAAMVLTGVVEAVARRARVPSVVAYLVLGMLLRLADGHWNVLGTGGRHAFALLADIGIIVLLFRVGLESNFTGLLAQLRPALGVWFGNVALSGVLAYVTARHWAGLDLAASLIIAVALTATSIGVAAAAWQTAGALDSANGRLMLDVAELDDISGVLLMAMAFALATSIGAQPNDALSLLVRTGTLFVVKFALFAALCLVFARYAEARLTRFASRLAQEPQRMLTVAGVGFVIAALAGWLGFSFAIGALFAGLVFSRDPRAVRTEARFTDLYAFFAPFFFIGIGLDVNVRILGDGLALGGALLAAAVVGKLAGAILPAARVAGASGAVLIGVSLLPRAEIALVVAHQGFAAGLLPERVYAALVVVSAATCIVAPWILGSLLARWPQPHLRGEAA